MANRQRHIIQSFFGSLGSDAFMAQHWPTVPYHENGDPARLPPVFQAPILNDFEMLAQVYRGPAFYSSDESALPRPIDRPPLELYRAGCTLHFGDVAPFVRGSRIFLGAFESELGVTPGSARMSVLASPGSNGGPAHYDTNDVFSVQLAGQREFHAAPAKVVPNPTGMQYAVNTAPRPYHYPQMTAGFPDPSDAEFERFDLDAGSVLFMPRGMWNYARVNGESVALSIIVDPAPAVDAILEQLKFTLLQDPNWRAPLYGAWDPDNGQGRRNLDDLLDDLRRSTARLNAEQVIRGSSGLAFRIDHIDENTRFQKIPTARVDASPDDGGYVQIKVVNDDIDRGSRETLDVNVREEEADLIMWLASLHQPVSGREIAAQYKSSFRKIEDMLKTMCRGELLVPLWFEPLPAN